MNQSPWITLILCCLLIFQTAPQVAAQQSAPPAELKILIIDGDGAINNIRQRTAREPIIQVEDENHRPVAGAAVTFTLPQNGASGVFGSSSHTFTAFTDANGRAVAQGLQPNSVAGNVQIRVDVSSQGRSGHTVINQKNILSKAPKSSILSTKVLTILAVAVAAGAVAGVCAAVCGSKGNSGAVITAGGSTVGAPH